LKEKNAFLKFIFINVVHYEEIVDWKILLDFGELREN